MHVLVTGGAGYVGSHVVRALVDAGHDVSVIDDLSSGHRAAVEGARLLVARCGDHAALDALSSPPDGVMHMAARCSVAESMRDPGAYYETNVGESVRLLDWMAARRVPWIIHSSTCAVYGLPDRLPIDETAATRPISAYGSTKLTVDRALVEYGEAHGLRGTTLRYFNAAGAHPDGTLGEHKTPASNLVPAVLGVALGRHEVLDVFGDDYDTADGTGVRDYVHVADLAAAHLAAMERLRDGAAGAVYNLGTENGASVLQVVAAARQVTGHAIPVRHRERRDGDPPALVASARLAARELGWAPQRSDLDTILTDAWRWHRRRPDGHHDPEPGELP